MSEESQAPGKAWGLRKPWKGIYRQASQEALNTLSPASHAPTPVNGILPIACCHLFGIIYYLASLGTDSESPFTLYGHNWGRFAKTNKTSGPPVFTGGPLMHASKPRKFSILLSWQDIQRPSAAGFVPWRLFSLATP